MNIELLNQLLNKASKLGAQGYEVLSWQPPSSAADDYKGNLVYHKPEQKSSTELEWYKK